MVFKKYGLDTVITSDFDEHIKAIVNNGTDYVSLLLSEVDEDRISHAQGISLTAKQARELAAALVHYAKEIEG